MLAKICWILFTVLCVCVRAFVCSCVRAFVRACVRVCVISFASLSSILVKYWPKRDDIRSGVLSLLSSMFFLMNLGNLLNFLNYLNSYFLAWKLPSLTCALVYVPQLQIRLTFANQRRKINTRVKKLLHLAWMF